MAEPSLLQSILTKISSYEQSPLTAQRALVRIGRGIIEGDVRDITHNIFDWFCEFNKSDLSPEDQAIMDADPDKITDEQERKQLLRRQAKVSKRAKAKNRKFTSKATPELVSAVRTLLEMPDHQRVADKLSYAAACAPHFSPNELVQLLEVITPIVASCAPCDRLSELRDEVGAFLELRLFTSPVEAARALYILGHGPISNSMGNNVEQMVRVLRGEKRGIIDYKREFPDFYAAIGKASDGEGLDIEKPDVDYWIRVAQVLPPPFLPKAHYKQGAQVIKTAHETVSKRTGVDQYESLESLFAEFKTILERGDLGFPAYSFMDETINDIQVQTIISMLALEANGDYMGNCTYSHYKSDFEAGTGVLYRLIDADGNYFNSDFRIRGQEWYCRETEGRVKGGRIPLNDRIHEVNREIARRLTEGLKNNG